MTMELIPAAENARDLLEHAQRLGLDPIRDIDLMWIVQDFLSSPLPVDWQALEAPDGVMHYVNKKLRYDVTTNPVEPRFKTLVQIIKESKVNGLPLDEVTVLELLDPIERAADVKEMAEYQGIDIRSEGHLMWIAKLAVLETVPEGWEEYVDATGRTLYRNLEKGFSTEDHPADHYFKALLNRERAKRVPYASVQLKYYTTPVAHFRNDEGGLLRTLVVPSSGTFHPFYDLYGQYYWYDMVSDKITMNLDEVRREPAAVVIQRIWRGYTMRSKLWQLHEASLCIARNYRAHEYRCALKDVNMTREQAAKVIQRHYHNFQQEIICSLEASGLTYRIVRQKVIHIQREYRAHLKDKVAKMKARREATGVPFEHHDYVVTSAARKIQDEFRAQQARLDDMAGDNEE